MSERLPAVSGKRVLRALRRAGFFVHHTRGSHHVLKHPNRPELRVVIPVHGNRPIKRGTLNQIIKDADLLPEGFRGLL